MTKTIDSFNNFYKHIEKINSKHVEYTKLALIFSAEILEKEAKDKIAHPQNSEGQFKAWEELAESTKKDKERSGYVINADYNPLYRTGELKDSIHAMSEGNYLFLGSKSEIMKFQEFGTAYIPPRSVIGLTMHQFLAQGNYIFGEMLVKWLSDLPLNLRRKTHGSL